VNGPNRQQGRLHLVLGGARSGKSRLALKTAEDIAAGEDRQLVFVATATPGDGEMAARIERHRRERSERWRLHEEPIRLAAAIEEHDGPRSCILVDCLTLWLSNCLHAGCWREQRDALLAALDGMQGSMLLVANETGLGVVPMGELSRRFVDASGFLNQRLAERCDKVTLVVAGLPRVLKDVAGAETGI